jgi:hypothetical protein
MLPLSHHHLQATWLIDWQVLMLLALTFLLGGQGRRDRLVPPLRCPPLLLLSSFWLQRSFATLKMLLLLQLLLWLLLLI